jgi:hemoglobin-like flavoprotein
MVRNSYGTGNRERFGDAREICECSLRAARALFRGDMMEQGAKLMAAIGIVVASLDRLEPMLDHIRSLGRRHAGYGVQDAHYVSVGEALLWTLEQGLGAGFTPEVREAWASAYGVLSSTMMDAVSEMKRKAA